MKIRIEKKLSLPVKSDWKRIKERNKVAAAFLDTVAAAEIWLEDSTYNDSFICVAGTHVFMPTSSPLEEVEDYEIQT